MAEVIRGRKPRYKTYEEMTDYERNIYAHLGHQEIHRISDKDKKISIRPKDTKKGIEVTKVKRKKGTERRASWEPKTQTIIGGTKDLPPRFSRIQLKNAAGDLKDVKAAFAITAKEQKLIQEGKLKQDPKTGKPIYPKKAKKDTSKRDTAIGIGLAFAPLAALLWKGKKRDRIKGKMKLLSYDQAQKRITHIKSPKQIKPSMLKISEIKKITHEKAPSKLAALKKSLWNKAMETRLNKGMVAKGSEQGRVWRQYVKGGPKVFFTENYKFTSDSFEKAAKGSKVAGVNVKLPKLPSPKKLPTPSTVKIPKPKTLPRTDVRIPKPPSSISIQVWDEYAGDPGGKQVEKKVTLKDIKKELGKKKVTSKSIKKAIVKVLNLPDSQQVRGLIRLPKGFLNFFKKGPLGLLLFAPEIKRKIERTIKETKEHKFKKGGYIGRKHGGRIGTSDGNEFVQNLYDD
jgi:hypothetical protein